MTVRLLLPTSPLCIRCGGESLPRITYCLLIIIIIFHLALSLATRRYFFYLYFTFYIRALVLFIQGSAPLLADSIHIFQTGKTKFREPPSVIPSRSSRKTPESLNLISLNI